MRRNVIVVVVAALLLSLVFVAGAPSFSRAAPSHALSPMKFNPPVAVGICPADGAGFCSFQFSPGIPSGYVYFDASDTVDTSAIVAVNDINATRDHLSNPVQKWTVSFASSTANNSYLWNGFYPLPFNLTYGGTWNITISGAAGGFASANFTVRTYYVVASVDQPLTLAGHAVQLFWALHARVNGGPYTAATNLSYYGTYVTGGVVTPFPGPITKISPFGWQGQAPFQVPTGTDPHTPIFLHLTALTFTAGKLAENETTDLTISVGALQIRSLVLCPAPGCLFSSGFFPTNSPVFVTVTAEVFYGFFVTAPAIVNASFVFHNGKTVVTPPGSPPATVKTNSSGEAAVSFIASSTVFSTTSWNSVNVTVVDPVRTIAKAFANQTFFLTAPSTSLYVNIVLSNSQYFGGDTGTATWSVGSSNTTQAGPLTAFQWRELSFLGNLMAAGTINSSASSGQFSFGVPLNYTGLFTVQVFAHNATAQFFNLAQAYAAPPTILLAPNEYFYAPGDSLTVQESTQGSAFVGATLWYAIVDANGALVGSGSVSNSQIALKVPSGAPSPTYTFTVWAQSNAFGTFASQVLTIAELNSFEVFAGIETKSSYADGSYQPGQTIQVSYSVRALGLATLPKTFAILIGLGATPANAVAFQSSTASGRVSFTIPSSTPAGTQIMIVNAGGLVPTCFAGCFFFTEVALFVEPNPSFLNFELGAGSGLTVGWLLLLVIVVVVGLVLYVLIRRRGPPSMVMSPVAAAATPPVSGGSPTEWTEPPSGGSAGAPPSDNPPMPTSPGQER